ncbi:rRNA-processing protein UTP23 [Apis mellifera caucasica]|uniref:rRNA-processing protein UTP23 homolog n=1 Tax=Apis mellifera TaxID=7460 RepID=A0A7M7H4G6_APIME|nr:rRNA-processing protein UTP23 homolog [Apis mellifera]KAG6802397.1 rRNA-processing protein UTP23 [Apis mellifera caucasica]KAG9437896.1 rRNA-processing protein UTP23 [Apis mellifera carnica]|eukprot:XP_006571179.1 rRNA-processing protein UTP23 homolog [Apis mellifera]
MKSTRQKKARKNLGFFINNFKFRSPFQILIDGTFALAALENKFNIQDQLSKYFQSDIKLLTTPCIILETEKLSSFSKAVSGAMQIVKQYPIHKCGHEKNSISGTKCLESMIEKNNLFRYIIATQDRDLQESLRKIPGVPIIYLHGKAPTLEAPSQASRKYAENIRKGLGMTEREKENIKILKEAAGIIEKVEVKFRKKKKKGPNPLSCLKKKKKTQTNILKNTNEKNSGKVKKRTKIKIAAHIKEALVAEIKNKLEKAK